MGRDTAIKDYVKLYQKWILNPQLFIEKEIIEPYNKVTGKNIVMTGQQLQAVEEVRKLVTAKLKLFEKETLNDEEKNYSKKIGISIMGGKGLGKDALLAWLIIWFMMCFPKCKIPCVSVSADQLSKALWAEISKYLQHSTAKDFLTLQNDKLFFNRVPANIKGKEWFAFPKTANPKASVEEQVETLSGVHEDYVMVVIDESSGIHDAVFSPLEGTLTQPCNFAFMVFNPTRSKGYAIDTQYKFSDYWIPMRWSAEESELGNKDVIERIREQYGVDSNPYRIRILGLPPMVDEHTLIPYDWIMDAVNREIVPLKEDSIVKGLDCGAGGDMSIIATRKGGKVFDIKRLTTQESQVLINWAADDFQKDGADVMRVDSIGIGWAVYGGLFDRLGSRVESADSRKQASNPEKYFNKRAEMHWRMREKFEKGLISIPNDPNLIDQLSVIRVSYEGGKVKVADKAEMKKKLGRSPDESDAVALSYYYDDDLFYGRLHERGRYCHQRRETHQRTSESWLGS